MCDLLALLMTIGGAVFVFNENIFMYYVRTEVFHFTALENKNLVFWCESSITEVTILQRLNRILNFILCTDFVNS